MWRNDRSRWSAPRTRDVVELDKAYRAKAARLADIQHVLGTISRRSVAVSANSAQPFYRRFAPVQRVAASEANPNPLVQAPYLAASDARLDRQNWDPRIALSPERVAKYNAVKRAWERYYDRVWPIDPATGRSQDAAHIKAVADGGEPFAPTNVKPMTRADHIAEHMANGDPARFARRRWIAEAFGGKVARGFGLLSIIPNITGLISGRIRTDTPMNTWSDLIGMPSPEDIRRQQEEVIKNGL